MRKQFWTIQSKHFLIVDFISIFGRKCERERAKITEIVSKNEKSDGRKERKKLEREREIGVAVTSKRFSFPKKSIRVFRPNYTYYRESRERHQRERERKRESIESG